MPQLLLTAPVLGPLKPLSHWDPKRRSGPPQRRWALKESGLRVAVAIPCLPGCPGEGPGGPPVPQRLALARFWAGSFQGRLWGCIFLWGLQPSKLLRLQGLVPGRGPTFGGQHRAGSLPISLTGPSGPWPHHGPRELQEPLHPTPGPAPRWG